MVIYSSAASLRLQYVINFIESVIGQRIFIIYDKAAFANFDTVKINYSNEEMGNEDYQIKPHPLLFQTNISPVDITVSTCRNNSCFFIHDNDSHGFDVFAAIFYLISRYEEYLPYQPDMYGRFAHENSIAYKNNFLTIPLVNLWIIDLMERLSINSGPKQSPFFIPTYDIDIAFAYKHQSIVKNVGGFFKTLLKGDIDQVIEQANVYSGKANDPFDVYEWLNELHAEYHLSPIYFFLLAQQRGQYDKNNAPTGKGLQSLIKEHAKKYTVGIHPSWQSGDSERILSSEIDSLKNIIEGMCTISRQHYIRMILPNTYRLLIKNGIKEDHSMGYGSINGFRASVTSPFYWYDLEKEEITNLIIRPYCYMDANCFFEQHLSAEEAGEELQYYYSIVKKVGGQFITIFHNHFLTDQPQWKPWKEMYERFLRVMKYE